MDHFQEVGKELSFTTVGAKLPSASTTISRWAWTPTPKPIAANFGTAANSGTAANCFDIEMQLGYLTQMMHISLQIALCYWTSKIP